MTPQAQQWTPRQPAEGRTEVVVVNSPTTDASAQIAAAFNRLLDANGKPTGKLVIDGIARVAAPLVFDLGFADVTADANATANDGQVFELDVRGALRPDAGVSPAVTVRGGYDAVIACHFDGGGQAGDIGLHIENLNGVSVRASGRGYAGIVLHADANGDTTKRVRRSIIERVSADGCGQALYMRAIEAFGQIAEVWDNASAAGSVFDTCADTTIGHWETFTVATQAVGLLFNQCNNFSVGVISMGDRPTEALVKIVGGDFGSITKIRVSGQTGLSNPTIAGLKLQDVSSIDIGQLTTFRCDKGLHILGGGDNGIRVKRHFSLTTDRNPLYIEGGTTTTPDIDVRAHYRLHKAESVKVLATVTGGRLRFHGYLRDMNTDSAAGIYAIDCAAAAMSLYVAGLYQVQRAVLAGSINHGDPSLVFGVANAWLGNPVVHGEGAVTAETVTANTFKQNNSPRSRLYTVRCRHQPADSTTSTVGIVLGRSTAAAGSIGYDSVQRPTGTPAVDVSRLYTIVVPPYWYFRIDLTNAVTIGNAYSIAVG